MVERAPYKRGVVSSILTGSNYALSLGIAQFIGAALLFALALFLSGCSTVLYSPSTGRPLARMGSDLLNVSYSGGGITFSAAKMSNSIPTRAAMLGANRIASTLGSAAIGLATPGSGTVPVLTRAAIGTTPHFVTKPGDGAP